MLGQPEYLAYTAFLKRNYYPATIGHLYHHESRQLFDPDENPVLDSELKAILKVIQDRWGEPNPPYYAVLVGDGDAMGEAINPINSWKEHQNFSRLLSGYAAQASAALSRLGACPIYTGGDDVLALVPLHRLLDSIRELRHLFLTCMAPYRGSP